MYDWFGVFERIVRASVAYTDVTAEEARAIHPFDSRDIHPQLPQIVRDLFDDGHYAQSSFEAFKFVDKVIQGISGETETGFKLMMKVFLETAPTIKLTPCSTLSERDEQKGYQFLFAGSVLAIRNPRGHEYAVKDDPDTCLDPLSMVSLLIRRIEKAGYKIM
jgi:uncharacterized protein (TIGR02391 family)